MSRYHKDWARRQRETLLAAYGGCCRVCGARDFLTFDCVEPRGHAHHAMDTSARMSFYRQQARLDNLQVLFQRCNARKGDDGMEQAFGELLAKMLQPLPEVEISGRPF